MKLAAIDMARKGSLKSVIQENNNATTAYADQLIQVRLNEGGFSLLETAVTDLSADTNTLDADLSALSGTMVTTNTKTGEAKKRLIA